MTPESSTRLMHYYGYNLYGDPSLAITVHGTLQDNRQFLPLVFREYARDPNCQLPILEGYEGGLVPPDGWGLLQTNANETWKILVAGGPFTGAHAADVEYDAAVGLQDEVLLSPSFVAAQAQLSFYSKGSVYWCRDTYDNCDLNAWLVIGDWGGGDDILLGEADGDWPGSWAWARTTVDLSPYLPGGTPVRIGFQYYGQDGAQVVLDQVTVSGMCEDQACPIDASFNGTAPGWDSESGIWYQGSEDIYTQGDAYQAASFSHVDSYTYLDFRARMIRYGDDTAANRLIIRGTPDPLDGEGNWNSAYLFQYTRAGSVSVYKRVAGGSHVALMDWTASPEVNQGDAWNTLRVVAYGPSLYFYVNGTLVWSGSDPDLDTGQVGVGMYRYDAAENQLRVDWAQLCTVTGSMAVPPESPPAAGGAAVSGDVNGVLRP